MSAQDPIKGARYTTAWPRHRGFKHPRKRMEMLQYKVSLTDSMGGMTVGWFEDMPTAEWIAELVQEDAPWVKVRVKKVKL